MSEETVYSDTKVSVTTTRVIISGTTYALRNITSVKMTKTPAKVGCATLLLLFGVLIAFVSLVTMSTEFKDGITILGVSVVMIALGILMIRGAKANYHVTINSASGEAHALSSYDQKYIEKVITSINDAIVRYQ